MKSGAKVMLAGPNAQHAFLRGAGRPSFRRSGLCWRTGHQPQRPRHYGMSSLVVSLNRIQFRLFAHNQNRRLGLLAGIGIHRRQARPGVA